MTAAHKLLSTCFTEDSGSGPHGGGSWSDDVFSTYLYTGNGATQTINNGIDLAGKGGLVWLKSRTTVNGDGVHSLYDTVRGAGNRLSSNLTLNNSPLDPGLTSFSSSGFSLGATDRTNENDKLNVSWTFRRAKRFFDIVTYTGDGTGGRLIGHSLGITPGMIVITRTNGGQDWCVWHRGLPSENTLRLNTTSASINDNAIQGADANVFILSPSNGTFLTNVLGATYVAYIWAHDTDINGVVQCGSFTTDGSGNATVNLGWEPQFATLKSLSATGSWTLLDSMRGWSFGGSDALLVANLSNTEIMGDLGNPTATGFVVTGTQASTTYIYIAIRRPTKPPTTGTQVYNAIARAGTGAAATVTGVGFAPDVVFARGQKNNPNGNLGVVSKLVGTSRNLWTHNSNAEGTASSTQDVTAFNTDGISLGVPWQNFTNILTAQDHLWFFRRSPTFFDIVCYRGTGIPKTEKHNLVSVPEMMWVKSRTATTAWRVYHKDTGNGFYLTLNSSALKSAGITVWNSTNPTSTEFSIGTNVTVNTLNQDYIAYLFATCHGVSKVGSYTGNGTSQLVSCGFSTGSRFVLIKRTDVAGDWYVWDSARGIHPIADPHLSLNTNSAEVATDDSIDQNINGFVVNQDAATNINVLGGQYIFYAIS